MDYAALTRFLAAFAGESFTLTVPMADLERVAGTLPAAAREDRAWWTNSLTQPQGRAWLAAGWRVSRVDVAGQIVSFKKA